MPNNTAPDVTEHTYFAKEPLWTKWQPHFKLADPVAVGSYSRFSDRINELIAADLYCHEEYDRGLLEVAIGEGILSDEDIRRTYEQE